MSMFLFVTLGGTAFVGSEKSSEKKKQPTYRDPNARKPTSQPLCVVARNAQNRFFDVAFTENHARVPQNVQTATELLYEIRS